MYDKKINQVEVPRGVRFDTPGENQGQIVEISYGTFGRYEAGRGDPYMMVRDASTQKTEFFATADAELRSNVWLDDEGHDYEAAEAAKLVSEPWIKEVILNKNARIGWRYQTLKKDYIRRVI